jgi:hypothetical protein
VKQINGGRPPKGPLPSQGVKQPTDERTIADRLLPEDRKMERRPGLDLNQVHNGKKLEVPSSKPIPKFPLATRESVYDNVKDVSDNEDDEGIDNDYSDDSGTPPKVRRGERGGAEKGQKIG